MIRQEILTFLQSMFRGRLRSVGSVALFVALGVEIFQLVHGKPSDRAVGMGYLGSLVMALGFWAFRRPLTNRVGRLPVRGELIVFLNCAFFAVVIETWFWAAEKICHAKGVAASPHLGTDLVITMPWYLLMGALFILVLRRYRYTLAELVWLGGIYELGADGLIGGYFSHHLIQVLVFFPLLIPLFAVVYAPMILPGAYLATNAGGLVPASAQAPPFRRYLWGLLPMLGLIPFFAYAVALMKWLAH